MNSSRSYAADCTRCPRLATFLAEIRAERPDYFARPVPPFGDPEPKLLIVGLAPGMHGANRTGRPFTGEYAGILLYETLHQFGYASAPESASADDGLTLNGARITNAVKCLPPQNKPETNEIHTCNDFLAVELSELPLETVVLALGAIAHNAVLRATGHKARAYKFGHGAEHRLSDGRWLIEWYHFSRYNTQTNHLTADIVAAAVARIAEITA